MNATIFELFYNIYEKHDPTPNEQQQLDKLVEYFLDSFLFDSKSMVDKDLNNNKLTLIIYNNLSVKDNEDLILNTLRVLLIIMNDNRILELIEERGQKI